MLRLILTFIDRCDNPIIIHTNQYSFILNIDGFHNITHRRGTVLKKHTAQIHNPILSLYCNICPYLRLVIPFKYQCVFIWLSI